MSLRVFMLISISASLHLLTPNLLAQEKKQVRGQLTGTLIDASTKTPVSGTLQLKNKVFERTVDVEGSFSIESLPAGTYRLTVRLRSRAEPIYFMKFVGSTEDMKTKMNDRMVDIHEYTVEFEVAR